MNPQILLKTQMENNLVEMRAGKRQFPQQNLHYRTNLRAQRNSRPLDRVGDRLSRVSSQMLQNPTSPANTKELQDLRRQLDAKTSEILKLKKELSQQAYTPERIARPVRPPPSPTLPTTPTFKRNADRFFQVSPPVRKEVQPTTFARQVYMTRKSPKPMGTDPITGLPRELTASPIRTSGQLIAKSMGRLRPTFT